VGGLGPSGVAYLGFQKGEAIPPILPFLSLPLEGFGGRPPVGGRPGAQGPPPLLLNPALERRCAVA